MCQILVASVLSILVGGFASSVLSFQVQVYTTYIERNSTCKASDLKRPYDLPVTLVPLGNDSAAFTVDKVNLNITRIPKGFNVKVKTNYDQNQLSKTFRIISNTKKVETSNSKTSQVHAIHLSSSKFSKDKNSSQSCFTLAVVHGWTEQKKPKKMFLNNVTALNIGCWNTSQMLNPMNNNGTDLSKFGQKIAVDTCNSALSSIKFTPILAIILAYFVSVISK